MNQKITLIAAIAVCSALGFMVGRTSSGSAVSDSGMTSPRDANNQSGGARPRAADSPTGPRARANGIRRPSDLATGERRGSQSSAFEMDPIAQLESIINNPDPLDRAESWLRYVKGLDSTEIADVVASFRNKGLVRDNLSEYSMLLTAWANYDPVGALDYASENTGTPFARQTILTSWATKDPVAALEWAKTNHEGDEANPWMVGVIRGIAANNPDQATALMNAMPYSRERGEALDAVQGQYMKQGPQAARVWALSIEDERLRAGAIGRVASDLARVDPIGTADWLLANPSEGATRAMSRVMERMAESDPEAAMTYFHGITDESVKGRAFAGLAEEMGETDPLAAARFIDANPSFATDDVYEEFIWNARRQDPVLGAQAIGSIRSADRQNRAYRQYIGHWLRRDYEAAVNWVGQNQLPQSVQRSVDGMIQKIKNEQQAPDR